MTVEITGYTINNGIVNFSATDVSEEHLQHIERTRDDGFERELNFEFDTSSNKVLRDLNRWLHEQKRVRESHPATWGEALAAVVGTITTISGKYLELE